MNTNDKSTDMATTEAVKSTRKAKQPRSAGNKRRLRYHANFAAVIAIAAVVVVLFNILVSVLADRYPLTLDISADKTFSLSEQSIDIAKQVENDIQLVIFADKDSFESPNTGVTELDTTLREFSNALKQYNHHSDNKITYTFLNPNQDPTGFAAYSKYDVQAGDMLFLCGDRYKVRTVYDSSYSNDLYSLDASSYSTTGTYAFESYTEKMLASTIHTIDGGEEHVVQVLTGHNEDSYVITGLKKLYELNGYTFEEMLITSSAEFNKKATTLLIAAPEKDYSDAEIKRVQDWLYNDGQYNRQLMVFVHPTASCPNLYEFLEVEYKVTVTDELIMETDYNRIQSFNSLYVMADVESTNYTTNAASTNKVYTPYARRLTTTLPTSIEKGNLGQYAIPLTQYPTSAKLAKLSDLTNADTDEDKSYKADEDAYPLTGMIVSAIDGYNNETKQSANSRVLVCGSAGIAYADYVQNSNLHNEELLLDSLNAMTGIENAITISGKTVTNETVTFSNAVQLVIGLGVFTIALPLTMLIVCLVVFIRRKNL